MSAKLIKRPKPKKSGNQSKAKERVLAVYKSQDARNEKRFQSDLKKALADESQTNKMSSRWGVSKGPDKDVLVKSWASGRKASGVKESVNVRTRKESGMYSSGPTPTGGTKKMIRMSKKRVRKNAASPQAKASAKKLY
jgi:hypothetical protein